MKNVLLIASSMEDYLALKPLREKIRKDASLYLCSAMIERHESMEMKLLYSRFEEEGFTVKENTIIHVKEKGRATESDLLKLEEMEYKKALEMFMPDMVVLYDCSYHSFLAAVTASQKGFPIIHISGSDRDIDMSEGSFGYGITKLSHLHFTASEKQRRQKLLLGEHPDRVFNVGRLDRGKTKPGRHVRPYLQNSAAAGIKTILAQFSKKDILRKTCCIRDTDG